MGKRNGRSATGKKGERLPGARPGGRGGGRERCHQGVQAREEENMGERGATTKGDKRVNVNTHQRAHGFLGRDICSF